jgi:uncharacterized protein
MARPLALVTGASAGIGREFSRRLAERGHDLLLVARDEARLEALAAELRAVHGVSVEVLAADLTRDEAVARVIGRVEATPPTLLVNNAGFGTMGPLRGTDPAAQERMVRLHVLAPMRLTRALLPGLLAAGRGGVINVSSVAGFLFSPGSVNYCATKAYLITFSEGLSAELAGTGIRVQALCPGFTRSEFHERMGSDEGRRRPRFLWLSAEAVVAASLAQLERGGPVVCIPGLHYKVLVAVLRLLPRGAVGWLARRGYRRM